MGIPAYNISYDYCICKTESDRFVLGAPVAGDGQPTDAFVLKERWNKTRSYNEKKSAW